MKTAPEPIRVKCLVVDDTEANLIAFCAVLQQDGVDVIAARSGSEALELMLRHDFALAFLDVQMPGMGGFELAELLRGSERTRHVPLIFITAGAHDQLHLFKGYESGAVDFLYKPIDPRVLKNKADVFFRLYRQRIQLAEELRQRTETLRLNEMFVAVLGHDLRNPLSALLAGAKVLERGAADPATKTMVDRITASGKRMGRMIDDMLDLARARLAGGIPIEPRRGDLGQIAERVVQEHRVAAPQRAIDLRASGDASGEWDADRIAQAISNLLGNALQHGRADALIALDVDGGWPDVVTLTVSNDGAIPVELLPHVFDPFRGSRRGGGATDGLGLGLYIVQQIVRAHGGQAAVSADDGRTVFTVTLPRRMTG